MRDQQSFHQSTSAVKVYSLHDFVREEAFRHKWIESERAGRDLGHNAINHWREHHWLGTLRACWAEHVEGKRYWKELDLDDFGLLNQVDWDQPMTERVMRELKNGKENLDLLMWVHCNREREAISQMLCQLNINDRRMDCPV